MFTKKLTKIVYLKKENGYQTYLCWEKSTDPEKYKFLNEEQLEEAKKLCIEKNIKFVDCTESVTKIHYFFNRVTRR